ncbi:hypothetical protein BH10BDE1_BH10BDE1_00360 [soil metagenome]
MSFGCLRGSIIFTNRGSARGRCGFRDAGVLPSPARLAPSGRSALGYEGFPFRRSRKPQRPRGNKHGHPGFVHCSESDL